MSNVGPFELLQKTTTGYVVSRCLHMVADLGVADVLGDEPQTAAELAAALDVNADALQRVMRILATQAIFEQRGNTFVHSPASQMLRSNNVPSLRAFVRMIGSEVNWSMFGEFAYTVKTGEPALDVVAPEGLWEHHRTHPEENQVFNDAMSAKAIGQVAGVLSAYDFSTCTSVGDIGGGHGHLLQAVLQTAPNATGVVFDLPQVIAESKELASPRIDLQGGDFFVDSLPSCELYLLMEVLHDWPRDKAVTILQAIRRAAPANAKLLVIEQIIPEEPGPHWALYVDILMLCFLGGKQYSLAEYTHMLEEAGWQLQRPIDTPAGVTIMEALAV